MKNGFVGPFLIHRDLTYIKLFKAILNKYIFIYLKGLEAKGPFTCLGLQVRFKRAYQTPINYSYLWLLKYYLSSSSNYLKIIFEFRPMLFL